jgi:hypothetical protein
MSVAVSSNYYGASSGTTDGYAAKFIPEIWSGKLQQKFYDSTVLSAIANTDWEGEIKDQGDKVKIRTVPSITINDYTKGLALSNQVPATSVVELNIDKGHYFSVVADDIDKTQADLRLMDIFSNDAAQQMKIKIDTNVLAGIVGGAAASTDDGYNRGESKAKPLGGRVDQTLPMGFYTTNAPTTNAISVAIVDKDSAGASNTSTKRTPLDHLLDLGQAMDEQNLPESGRFVVVPAWFAAMLKKGDLKNVYVTGDATSIARNGQVGTIDRFTVYVSNLLPKLYGASGISDTNGGTGKTGYSIFAGTKDALTFASQVTKVETLRSTSTFGDIMRGLNVYGFKVVTPKALVESLVSK